MLFPVFGGCEPGGWVSAMRPLSVAVGLCLWAASASALAGTSTPAGTRVVDNASVTYRLGNAAQSALSASSTLTVDQLIDVSVAWQDSSVVAAAPASNSTALTFVIANDGNGTDRFSLSVSSQPKSASGFTASGCGIWFDSNNDGVYSSGDQAYSPGVNDPTLTAGGHQRIFVVCGIPASASDASESNVTLSVASDTLTGPAGTTTQETAPPFVLAETGSSAGQASAVGTYQASGIDFDIPLTQTVTDPNGGNKAAQGSTITYTIKVQPKGSGTGDHVQVSDPIPANTTYIPGSLTLNGVALTDARSDADGGYYDAGQNAVFVNLGARASNASPDTITFKVKINPGDSP